MDIKICSNCNESFQYDQKKRLSICHECHLKKRRELRRSKNIGFQEHLNLKNEGKQRCKNCDNIKELSEFRHNRRICCSCEKEKGRDYRKSVIGSTKSKEWINSNCNLYKSLQANWYQNNKTRINAKYNERMKHDLEFKLINTCRKRLRLAIKKENSTCEYLGCNRELLIKWITFNFTSQMNIQNHGKYWHLDHVIPIKFEGEPFTIERLHWTNLSPYMTELNLSKNNNIDKAQIKNHLDSLKKFIHIEKINLEEKYIDLFARHLNNGESLRALTTISN